MKLSSCCEVGVTMTAWEGRIITDMLFPRLRGLFDAIVLADGKNAFSISGRDGVASLISDRIDEMRNNDRM